VSRNPLSAGLLPLRRRASDQTPEDWRVLRALSLYRLLLDILLLTVFESGYTAVLISPQHPHAFHWMAVVYAVAALLLLLPVIYRRPQPAVQAHIHFAVDLVAILGLVYTSGGVGVGLAVLMITPSVGTSLVLDPRMARIQAAVAVVALFAEEFAGGRGLGDITGTVLLSVILFGSTVAANAVAQRARRSEALAARVGSDLANLTKLNERIIDNLETGVLVVDGDGFARVLNAAARRLLGTRHDDQFIPLAQVFPALARTMQDWHSNPSRAPAPLVPRSGMAEVLPRLMPLGTETQASTLILLDETSRLREQAQQMKLASLGRLSASIAHEIRNPLSAISHAAQLLSESEHIRDEDRRLLGMIERHGERIDRIVRDVLALSRRGEAAPSLLELRGWLTRTLDAYGESFPERRGQIDIGQVPEGLFVRFDPNHLQQLLVNLWNNSWDHGGRAAGELRITLRAGTAAPRRQPFLEVLDNGSGIPDSLLERVFEPFFTTAHAGSGLGLYLARELCEYNQARLEYVAGAGGACFRLIFAGGDAADGGSLRDSNG
jgi:two-component system sensor histidine kinase PilS (NtrC family)